MAEVRSINPVVGETNDGGLNAIRSRPITAAAVRAALEGATTGPVVEGSVGAGTGTQAFSWKGGIGTSSRILPGRLGGWAVGVLVQSNFGGILQVLGAPVGRELGTYAFKQLVDPQPGDGSIIMVVATDAPLSDRNLERLAARAIMGLARTGSFASNGSGDYAIAFITAESVQMGQPAPVVADLPNDDMAGLFAAAVEATEEAIYNSMFMATTVESRSGKSEAIPLDKVSAALRKYGIGK
jgi:D-aminopeptidase